MCLRAILLIVALSLATIVRALPAGFQQETVLTGLTEPVDITQLPDGRMLVLEKAGKIKIFDPSVQPGQATTYLTITDIYSGSERGLATIALDPDFSTNGYFYVYYTNASSYRNRISRFTHQGSTASLASELLIWQDNEIFSDCCHYGGGIGFGPDGKLYLATGEEFDGPQAQDMGRAGGKIIRINKDGSIPADNPFVDGPGGNLDEIWALGLRNPYRAFWDLVDNRFFIGEVGGNVQETAREDLVLGRAGANYGWPFCEGQCADPAYDDPIYDYGHTGPPPNGGAITAGYVARGNQFPASYNGVFFFGDYAQSFIKYLVLNPDNSVASVNDFATDVGAPVSLFEGSDGAMYVVDYFLGRVLRFLYNSGNQAPVITSTTVTPTSGTPPLTVNFSATASDPENDPLVYHWIYGDGGEDYGQNVTHDYTGAGAFDVVLEVNDGTQSVFSEPQTVQVGTPPTVVIDSPVDGLLFRAGNTIAFSGTASDPDETIPAANYLWDILFIHNAHTHPALTQYVGTGSTIEINTSGHDYHDDTGYRFTLTVTDSDGLQGSDVVEIYPDKVDMTFQTVPSGIPVFLDGIQFASPFTYDTLIGFDHVLAVPATTCQGGQQYDFVNWSDGGSATHQITVPTVGATLTASFASVGPCTVGVPTAGLVTHLEADAGVSVTGGDQVTGWADQSAQGNSLTSGGAPRLIGGVLNGHAVIDFDGVDDKLERIGGLSGLPSGNADRTMYVVTNYRGNGFGGLSYGQGACNRTFGTVVAANGNLMVQGWCPSNDLDSGVTGNGAGWLVQSAVYAAGQVSHYRDGNLIDTRVHNFNTVPDALKVGAEIVDFFFIDMQVAAVLIYDHALSSLEQQQVDAYLQQKYFGTGSGNVPPVANDDSASVANGGSVAVDVLANDADSDGALVPSTVLVIDAAANGTTSVNATSGAITYTHDGSAATSDTFTYQVNDDGGLTSNLATVYITTSGGGSTALVTAGLVTHLEADAGVSVTGADQVTGWADQSGLGNHLTAGGDPRLLAGALNGHPVIDFDAVGDKLERVGGLQGLPGGNANRTVYLVANFNSGGFGGFAYGNGACNQTFGTVAALSGNLMVQGWCPKHDFDSGVAAVGSGWLVQSAVLSGGQAWHYLNGTLIDTAVHSYNTVVNKIAVGAEIADFYFLDIEVAAVLVYDRALSSAEQQQVQTYLQQKYFNGGGT